MGLDILACYGAANLIGKGLSALANTKLGQVIISSISMLYGTLASLSPKSIVVLGKYSSGQCGGYIQMANKIGGKCFQIPQTMYKMLDKLGVAEKLNSAWLKGVMSSGARILFNTNPNSLSPQDTSPFAMEVQLMKDAGYEFIEVIEQGIQCWETVCK